MLKATRTSAVLLGLVTLIGSSAPAFAEVQNVKVGGDVTTRGFWRDNLDLRDNDGTLDDQRFFTMTTGLNIGADLTENVAAFIRLSNERNVGVFDADNDDINEIGVSQSYVRFKELFYSPLTLTIGRQPIVWGRGFVLGSGLIPNVVTGGGASPFDNTAAPEFTDYTAFDAVRASLDFAGAAAVDLPLTLDLVYIKLNESAANEPDDTNLLGFNVGTKLDAASTEVEAYYLNKWDRSGADTGVSAAVEANHGNLSTMGIRGSAAPIEGSSVYGELAYQFGHRGADPTGVLATGSAVQAWAANLGAEFTATDVAMTPKVGAEWIFYSGDDQNGAVSGWDPIARGYYTTLIREFQAVGFHPADQTCFANGAGGAPATTACTGSATNQHQFSLYGSLKPIEDLTVAPRLSWFFNDVGQYPDGPDATSGRTSKRKHYVGMEWDTVVTYNYTDDVQFGVIYGLFAPGGVYRAGRDRAAQEIVTTVGVKF